MNKYVRFLTDKKYRFYVLDKKGFYKNIDDAKYLKKLFGANYSRALDLENPKTFREKLQWLKLYNRRPEYAQMVDKYEAKKYVASIIGDEHIIPTYGVWDSVDDIDFASLPEKYVMKTTHDSGTIAFCKNDDFDVEAAKKKMRNSLGRNYFCHGREWAYKYLKPRVIVEKYLEDGINPWPPNHKFFCFDGEVKVFYISRPRESGDCYVDFYDADCNPVDLVIDGLERSGKPCEKDATISKMLEIASTLSRGIPQVRVDLYNINGHIYFGELTLFHSSGIFDFNDEKWDTIMGEWIKLPQKHFEK